MKHKPLFAITVALVAPPTCSAWQATHPRALCGRPLTHERFLNRFKGTYGPELAAGVTDFPGAQTAVTRLLCCGDSTWPGIGVPAVAGSGMAAAHAIASAEQQKALLEDMRRREVLFPIP